MEKRRIRFNFIDLLILLAGAAAIFVLLYVFVLSGRKSAAVSGEAETVRLEYVIEIQNVDEKFAEIIKKDQPVQDAIKRKNIGTVTGVAHDSFQKIVFNYESGEEVLSSVEDRITLVVTIQADATEGRDAYTVNGEVIRVGEQYSLIFPGMYGVGFCTSLKETADEE